MDSSQSFFFCALLWISAHGTDCPYEECPCDDSYILCNDRSLKAMPQKIMDSNTSPKQLELDDNNIVRISAGSLPSNLTLISLLNNPTETIDDTALEDSANTLESLTFSAARFTQVPKAVLSLKSLKSLSIYDTNILTWNGEAMKRIGQTVTKLDLDTVGLTTWPAWIQSFSQLTELSVAGSSISHIPDDALDHVNQTLTILGLNNNSLTTVPKTLSKLTAINSLLLQQNRITDITWLPQLSKLTSLSLNSNRISNASQLSQLLRYHGDSMVNLDIYDNHLTAIPDLSFMTLMPILDFTNNHISDPSSGSVRPALAELKLGNNYLPLIPKILKNLDFVPELTLWSNHITSVQATDFPISATEVDLQNNLITELTDSSFPPNSFIEFLTLNRNPLSKISPQAFDNLPHLSVLNLQYTRLTRLPLAIASLASLNMLDVTGSASLVCTCMEKSLEDRISSLIPGNVLGECGQLSIYSFFTQLSPDCP